LAERKDGRIFHKEAEHRPIGRCGARREKTVPALLPERLADVLIGRPSCATWCGRGEPDTGKPLFIAEIGHVECGYPVAPDVSRKLPHRWYPSLGEVAIPLRPQRLLVIGEIEGVDDVAMLPAVVARRLRPKARVSAVRDLTQPRAGGINRNNPERQRVRPQTAPGDSSSETTRATRRALPRAINSSGF
jgi:hypothetical protein